MRKKTWIVAVALAACSGPSAPRLPKVARGQQVIVVQGAIKGGPYALGDADLDALPQGSVRGQDPRSGREALWEGAALAAIVASRQNLEKQADTAIVRTSERIAVAIPLTVIRQLKPVLAARADGDAIPARLLAWPNLERAGLPTDPRQAFWWARDVVSIDVVEWQTTVGRALATPPGAPDAARLGADHFGARCLSCHALRGAGGEKGPELTRVTSRLQEGAFRTLLADHPGWRERGLEAPGEEAVEQVWSFLRSIETAAANDPRVADVAAKPDDE